MKKKSKRAKALSKIKHHDFAGNKYRLVWETPKDEYGEHGGVAINGLCEEPGVHGRKITIDPDLTDKELLATLLDEGIHACLWALDNEFVDKMSESLSDFVWRAGFRFKDENSASTRAKKTSTKGNRANRYRKKGR